MEYNISKINGDELNCSICGNNKGKLMKRNDKYICKSCYKKYFAPKRECSICHNIDLTEKIIDGKNICRSCYRKSFRPKRICSICNKEDYSDKIVDGKYICRSCYKKNFRPKRLCSLCNKEGYSDKIVDGKYICRSCYSKTFQPNRLCSLCNKEGYSAKIVDGKYICFSCYRKTFRPKRLCFLCGSYNYVNKIYNNKPICKACYYRYYQPKKGCSICGNLGLIAKVSENTLICMNCYRQLDTTCDKCGAVIKQYNKILGLCSNCYYLEKIQFLLKTENELLNTKAFELFTKFYETLIKYRTSKSTFESLVSQLDFFKYISKCDIIDKFSYDFFSYLKEEYNFILSIKLENFLIRENLLTPLTEMEEFIKLSKYYLSKVSTIFFAEYKSFTNYMLERKCKLTRNGWQGKFKLSTYELILYCSQKFLYFLSDKINSINELTNELLDEYFTQKQWTKSHLHYFIKWLNKSVRLFHKLNIIKVKQHVSICTPYTEEELFEIVENLNLSNSFMHKVLGFLLILYGIRPSEIVELKMSDYLSDSSKLFIRNVWISLNPYIKKILDGYIKFERSDKLSMGNKVDWLFYGYKFNTHLSKGRVGVILRRYKLDVKKSFCTAVTNLILNNKSVPSVVIHGTGINISTVMNYYKALNIDSAYNLELDHNFMYVEQSVKTSRYYIYILKCNDGSYYTGYTSNLQKRLQQHQEGTGCTYTKTRTPVELVYTEELPDKPSALKREKQIKKLTIFDKEKLIEKSRVN